MREWTHGEARSLGSSATDFIKMQGAGNDFVLVDGRDGREADWPALARRMSDRHFGVGADGLLLIRPSTAADFRMEMWNPDGSVSQMCGNGLRCFGRYLFDRGAPGETMSVETGAGVLSVQKQASSPWLRVGMGKPILAARDIPVGCDANPVLHLPLPGLGFDVTCVSMGNPHAVRFVEDVGAVDLEELGPRVEHLPVFPQRVNFHLCQVLDRSHLRMRSWERGAGITLACGTGAAATTVAAHLRGLTTDVLQMDVPGGQLELSWDGEGQVFMSGPVEYVFDGRWPD